MKKKVLSVLLCAAMAMTMFAGCGSSSSDSSSSDDTTATADDSSDATAADDTADAAEETASGSYAGLKVALVAKSAGNAFFEIAAATFVAAVEAEGGTCDVLYPEEATADAQIKVLENAISQGYDAICLSANDTNALQATLEEAMEEGIAVTSFDSAPNSDSRQVFINQAGTTAVAQALVDAVYDLCDGAGQWAILSATSQASNQNAWIAAMEEIIAADSTYSGLELVEIAYGDDEADKSTDQTEALLANYPDLECICAPTTVGIAAAAKYLQDTGSSVKLTGLGLPSEMEAYTGDDCSCPYFYLWDMEGLGTLSAYVTMGVAVGELTGALGETFTAGSLGTFTVTEADDGGTEIVLGEPLQFNGDNVSTYAALY